ncbi:hypothetical protein Bca4012_020133 [Brassica carinata]
MTRIVPLHSGISLTELLSNIFREFFDNADSIRTAVLSYWPPNTKELATGLTTPPIILTNDGAVSYFYQHFQANKGMNLFVPFNTQRHTPQISRVDENPPPFTMPNQPIKRMHSPYSSSAMRQPSTIGLEVVHLYNQGIPSVQPRSCPPVPRSSVGSQVPRFSINSDDKLDQQFADAGSSGPSKTQRLSLIDETLFCGDELLENMSKEDPEKIPDSWVTDKDKEDASDTSIPPDIDDVQTRGYDEDFWAPLIDNHLGGSNAAEVMAGISVPKTAPHIIHCATGDAFDHTVFVSGELPPYCKPEVCSSSTYVHPHHISPVHTRSCPPGPCSSASTSSACTSYTEPHQPHPPTPPARETRPLSDISDEEFDIPPLFDDTLFKAEDVPDLDIDDDEPCVGKLYASKQDCQIGLAIYAIKEQFHLWQTRTTRHSFVLSCHDTVVIRESSLRSSPRAATTL